MVATELQSTCSSTKKWPRSLLVDTFCLFREFENERWLWLALVHEITVSLTKLTTCNICNHRYKMVFQRFCNESTGLPHDPRCNDQWLRFLQQQWKCNSPLDWNQSVAWRSGEVGEDYYGLLWITWTIRTFYNVSSICLMVSARW